MKKPSIQRIRFATLLAVMFCLGSNFMSRAIGEDFESFSLGDLDGQNGWTSEPGAQIENTSIAGFGDRSIRVANGIRPFDGNYLISPILGSGYGVLSLDIQIDDPGVNAEYMLFPRVGGGRTANLHFKPGGLMTIDRSVGACSINDALIGGSWSKNEVMHLEWHFEPDPAGSVVSEQTIILNGDTIYSGFNHLGCGADDEIDSFALWSTGSDSVDVTLDNVSFSPVLPSGDINDDGVLSLPDIDSLVLGITLGISSFDYDMNGDTVIDLLDLDRWLAVAGAANLPSGNPYLRGDLNLDGMVDGADFLGWNANKFTETGRWSEGDFNADGVTDGADFILWNQFKFTASDVSAVPEPTCGVLGGLLLAAAFLRRRIQS